MLYRELLLGIVLAIASTTCGGSQPNGGSGGSLAGGGVLSQGGSLAGGGVLSQGGSLAGGGVLSQGGSLASGGVLSQGGSLAGGGALSQGGSLADGGAGGVIRDVGVTGTAWDAPNTGNPFLPGYFADPSIFYDAKTSTFFVFATTDGSWIDYSAEPMVWASTDFLHWRSYPLVLPAIWPTHPLWASSVTKHPKNGKYYLVFAANSVTYIAYADSPLGPWSNATAGTTTDTASLYKQGEMWGMGDGFDAQFFVDDDGAVYLTFGGSGRCGIAKLAFGADYKVTIDNSDSQMTDGTVHKFKQLSGLTNYLEGSVMFKSGGRYFITYSVAACQNYNVQYAVGASPTGPFTHAANPIVVRDDTQRILGPGHNSLLQYQGDTYIVYHRQHYQYVDVKRQTCIDKIEIIGDTISEKVQSHAGVWAGTGALESLIASARATSEPNLAVGNTVLASSESAYKGGRSASSEVFAEIKGFYAARFAVDENLGTRWAPDSLPGTLLVDLGADKPLGRCETTFEYAVRAYRYRIDYLPASAATDIQAARLSTAWQSYADRAQNTERLSPITDPKNVVGRYLRLMVLSADLPSSNNEVRTILETDYADRVSVVEFKVFAPR